MRREMQDNQTLEEVENDNDLLSDYWRSELMLTLGWSLMSESESRSKLSGDGDGSQVGQMGIKVDSKVRSRLVSIVVKVDIWTEEVQSKLGFRTGNPRIRFSHTVPAPWHTVPATGTTRTRPINRVVSNETRGIHDTRGILIIKIIKIIIIVKM